MRVLMLGWEFPPFISGGLGTACHGLTRALSQRQTQITFVLPKAVSAEYTTHVRLLSPQSPAAAQGRRLPHDVASTYAAECGGFENVRFKAIPSRITSPYVHQGRITAATLQRTGPSTTPVVSHGEYEGDLMSEVQRYAALCMDLARGIEFDVIHAHDWLTFPAGMAVARATGKPLVVHVHSTEFDRSGENIHQPLYDIERRGMHAAVRVVVVSNLTRCIVENRYGVPPRKIDVIYNGVENGSRLPTATADRIKHTDKIVLYLGRITMQKGPEYFLSAAKKVLEQIDDVKFIMAGTGDMTAAMIELAARYGIGHRVLFTGFLRGADVARVFQMADVYVMPSVSEPFGIAALEAIRHDVPVIISKTSGVSEVLQHVLKVDFWDIEQMADKIIAVLQRPPLAKTLREHADIEVQQLTWDDAAGKCMQVYEAAMEMLA